jgi:ubiquinone/menaquinone biosynthesis C-methylase UbiE
MGSKDKVSIGNSERMPDMAFRLMSLTFDVIDLLHPHVDGRAETFGIKEGSTVVDYGCGPGRYTTRFSKLVGDSGKVYAVDIHELAIDTVKRKIARLSLRNVEPVLARGYNSSLPDHVADTVCVLDMFFGIKEPTEFLKELKRIVKKDGMLVIDDGHQPRDVTKKKILASNLWVIEEEIKDHLKCRPKAS